MYAAGFRAQAFWLHVIILSSSSLRSGTAPSGHTPPPLMKIPCLKCLHGLREKWQIFILE